MIRSLLHSILTKASVAALERADRNCRSIRVFASPPDLQEYLQTLGGSYALRPDILRYVYGVYERSSKAILLADFATDDKDYEQYVFQEFAHAIDGPEYELSQSADRKLAAAKIGESPHFDLRQSQLPHESFAQALVLA